MRTHSRQKKMVIAIASETFPPDINGASRFTERLAVGMARRGHEVHVIAPSSNKNYGTYREIHDGTPLVVHRLKSYRLPQHPTLRWVSPFGLLRRANLILNRIKPDVVHVQTHMLVGRFFIKAARNSSLRLVATNHTMPENLVRYSIIIPRVLERLAMKIWWLDAARELSKADVITTPTRRAAEILENNTNLKGVLAISCGIDAKPFATAPSTEKSEPIALYVGRLDYEKHVHLLIEAMAKIPASLGQVEIVGDGAERESLEKWAFELGVSDRIRFLGHVSESELRSAFARCMVFVMPSIAELQSIATMEAMASGRPVIGANAAALPHLVHSGENGYLFEPGNVADLATQLMKIFTADKAELRRLSRNSLHLIQSHDIETTLDRFEQIYRGHSGVVMETDDNSESYLQPITNSASVQAGVDALRSAARKLKARTGDIRDGVLERLSDVSGEVLERFEEIGFQVVRRSRKTGRRLERAVRKALDRFRRHDR